IPHLAIADIDVRTTPEAQPEYLFGLIKAHVEKQGYHLVPAAPSDQERADYDKLASLAVIGVPNRATRTPLESPLGKWAHAALQKTSVSGEPIRIRMSGGSNPSDSLEEILGAPHIGIPLVNGDNNQHTFDENMRVGHYVAGIRTLTGLLRSAY